MLVNPPTCGQLSETIAGVGEEEEERIVVSRITFSPQQQYKITPACYYRHVISLYEQLCEKLTAGTQLKKYRFVNNLRQAVRPNGSSDTLRPTSTAINTKRNIDDFFDQLNRLFYHCNHLFLR